ncbi:MAG: hypothetical protein QM820_60330 [Minicystis sp.]
MKADLMREVTRVAERAGVAPIPESWAGIDVLLPLFEKMKDEGAVVVIKLDGQRVNPGDNGPYTVVVSGGRLGGDFARLDADSLEEAAAKVIIEYASRGWGYSTKAHMGG